MPNHSFCHKRRPNLSRMLSRCYDYHLFLSLRNVLFWNRYLGYIISSNWFAHFSDFNFNRMLHRCHSGNLFQKISQFSIGIWKSHSYENIIIFILKFDIEGQAIILISLSIISFNGRFFIGNIKSPLLPPITTIFLLLCWIYVRFCSIFVEGVSFFL